MSHVYTPAVSCVASLADGTILVLKISSIGTESKYNKRLQRRPRIAVVIELTCFDILEIMRNKTVSTQFGLWRRAGIAGL